MASTAKTSQEVIDEFWKTYITPTNPPTKASAVLPKNVYAEMVKQQVPHGATAAERVETTYLEARKACEAKVAQIVKECIQINQKYSDPYFDLDDGYDCLYSLDVPPSTTSPPPPGGGGMGPGGVFNIVKDGDAHAGQLVMFGDGPTSQKQMPPAVKRVGDIFDNPRFFVDGPSAKDIHQGANGDCWFLSAIAALCNLETTQHMIERVCVARDQDVGVYGFLLYRDGEWTSVIIDDKLYLRSANYEDADIQVRRTWENNRIRVNSVEEYRKEFQSNSRALYYGQSTHPDETWVPLLEKAFAKAHGDYSSIEGGYVGDGVEDLTGGLSNTIVCSDILSRDRFWTEGLMKVNKEFLFGCGSQEWDDPTDTGRDGIIGGHAYSILRAVEYNGERLVLVKNPWGSNEWNGPWSDGSSQWNADAIKALDHTFGDDGIFWIRYSDLLRKYNTIYRTRLFMDDWKVIQQWTSVAVPWAGEYQDTKFEMVINKGSPTVIVLSQLDDRYFRGLTGQYTFKLSFRVHRAGEEDYIMRTFGEFYGQRSVHSELFLEAGKYEVRVKISAERNDDAEKVEDVVKANWLTRREKLLQVGLSYDLAHAKGQVKESGVSKEVPPKPLVKKTTITVTKSTTTTETKQTVTTDADDDKPAAPATKEDGKVSELASHGVLKPKAEEKEGEEPKGQFQGEGAEWDDEDARPEAEQPPPPPPPPPCSDTGDAEDAWGAGAVIGLRVFCKDADATIQIIRPVEAVVEKLKLDVDDPAVDAAKSKTVVKSEEKVQPIEESKEKEKEKEVVEKKEEALVEADKEKEKEVGDKKEEPAPEKSGEKGKEVTEKEKPIEAPKETANDNEKNDDDAQTDDVFDDAKEDIFSKDDVKEAESVKTDSSGEGSTEFVVVQGPVEGA